MKSKSALLGLAVLTGIFFTACKKDKYTDRITVRMTDAPAAFDSVNVEIVRVDIHSDAQGWISLPSNPGLYNLLELQNGVDTVLATAAQLPAGHVSQMRLILGNNNYVVSTGMVTQLELSSQDLTGLKLNLNYTFDPNVAYEILFDFVASESIVEQGNGKFRLKPVLKTVSVNPI